MKTINIKVSAPWLLRSASFSSAEMCRLTGQQVFSFLRHAARLGASQSDGVAPVLPAPGSGAGVGASLHAII